MNVAYPSRQTVGKACWLKTSDFDYELPPDRIAQTPALRRDQSRLLVFERPAGEVRHRLFYELPAWLRPGDLLVLNNSRVLRARLRGVKTDTGAQFEALLLEENGVNDWTAMFRPAKRIRPGSRLRVHRLDGGESRVSAEVAEKYGEGRCRLRFLGVDDVRACLEELGEVPLPPYIQRLPGNANPEDQERYQTVFASEPGSVAAPTAGLHFTPELLAAIRGLGVATCLVTLHVGPGTFAPVKAENLPEHPMHEEYFEVGADAAAAVASARREGRRVVAVGTTSLRVLESVAARNAGQVVACQGRTRLFIYPPYRFQIVDVLLTNFHLPRSTLLMLVSAFATPGSEGGRDLMLSAYQEAIREKYRFFSYGDAMLIV